MSKGRVLTLRGTFSCADNAASVDNQIFSNESMQLTKGWVVEAAWVWPQTIRAITGAGDGRLTVAGSLATDDGITGATIGPQMAANDNRQIAWFMQAFQLRDAASDFIDKNAGTLVTDQLLIDPEHLVTSGLYFNMYVTSDNATSPTREYNYMVVLREKKVSAKEAILSIIKAKAQDVEN